MPGNVSRKHISLSNGISLLVTAFTPSTVSIYPPVVMVPGLFSVVENFRHLLPHLTRDFAVYYVETREKNTSLCPEGSVFSIETMAADLNDVLDILGFTGKEYLLLGYSMGATVVMEGMYAQALMPTGIILVGPSGSFDFPAWSLRLARVAAPVYKYIKPLLKAYIKFFHVNHREDPEMHEIQSRVLDSANPYRLCATVQQIARYNLWDRLQAIRCPLLIIGASRDIFHNHDDSLRLSKVLKDSSYIDLVTNQRNHGIEVVTLIEFFLKNNNIST